MEGEQNWVYWTDKYVWKELRFLVCQPICLLDNVSLVEEVTPITTFSLGDTMNDNLKELLLIISISYSRAVTHLQGSVMLGQVCGRPHSAPSEELLEVLCPPCASTSFQGCKREEWLRGRKWDQIPSVQIPPPGFSPTVLKDPLHLSSRVQGGEWELLLCGTTEEHRSPSHSTSYTSLMDTE